ncbi:putative arginine--tRNA ligase, mitochondrial [Babylonia areolata]|uniref:putative arginine--tRNA ligase, mitochondrial n=1 Tax=Babylonia areolata TaxID=304850 RepID=UPI003FD31453
MSGYFRRVIAQRILRTLSKHGKLGAAEVDRLERNVARLVRTQDIRRKAKEGDAQYRLDVSQLAQTLGESSSQGLAPLLPSITGDVIEDCKQEKNAMTVTIRSEAFYQHLLSTIQRAGSEFGSSTETGAVDDESPQTVLVEYSSPNIAKPFHAGHLRSTIIGNFIANLYQCVGHTVHRVNYLGDWGTQFGLLALGFQRYGDEKLLSEDPLLQLFKVYVQINQDVEREKKRKEGNTYAAGLELFSRLERGEPEVLSLWENFRQLSMEEYTKMYQRLGVNFTETQCESDYSEKTRHLVTSLHQKGWLRTDEKGVIMMMFIDVAAALDRQEHFQPDRVHYVVEGGQLLHFRQLVGVLQQLGVPWADRPVEDIHIKFGRIEGMSSRRGTVVFLRDILDEARGRILQSMKEKETTRTQELDEIADKLAVSAVIVQDLKGRRQNNYTFSWDRMLSFSADSGVFLQYAHARLCSLLSSCDVEKTDSVDVRCLQCDAVHQLMTTMARYPELVEETLTSLEPCHVVQYLLKLSHLVNSAYSTLPVKGEPVAIAQARLLVFDSARQVLSNGMRMVGLQPLRQM